jgi:hypothetical protein
MKKIIFLLILLYSNHYADNSNGSIVGKVFDKITKEPLPGVNIVLVGTEFGTASNDAGKFQISNVQIGIYQIKASFVGYDTQIKSDIVVNSARPTEVVFELSPAVIELEGITVTSGFFDMNPTEITSLKTFSYEEIRRTPGGFEDVVRALSLLPGVAQSDAGRNDLIVRGGAPSENLFVLDGFVIPNINHFGTQGASGGPLSFVNLDYVNETSFSTGGFSAAYGDKLSSVLKIDLREGRTDKLGGKALISATQFGLNFEGPLSEKSNFIFSARRSYLDFIFNAAGFNFVPEYYDVLGKYTYDIDSKSKLSYIFIAAFDKVKFNNKNKEDIYDNARILGSNQNQYLTGISLRRLIKDGFYTFSISRNFVDYDAFQKDTLLKPIFTNKSREAENEMKLDFVYKFSPTLELNTGISTKLIKYNADILFPKFFVTSFGETLPITSLSSGGYFNKSAFYSQLSELFFHRWRINFGLRADYFDAIKEKFYLSPRFSTSYMISENTSLNFSTGLYYQFPSYIWLFAENTNKNLRAIDVNQYIFGIDQKLRKDVSLKLEGFYKNYYHYPASKIRPYLVLANTGAGFGGAEQNFDSFGLEPLASKGTGNVYGFELSMQKKYSDIPFYGITSLTYSKSNFAGIDGKSRIGKYDQTWIFNLTAGYVFNERWEVSAKFRFSSGNTYTPYNSDGTQSISNYLSERFQPVHSLDIRVDRRWDFDGWSMITYIDIQNIYNRKNTSGIRWDYKTNKPKLQQSFGILPSIGINLEF